MALGVSPPTTEQEARDRLLWKLKSNFVLRDFQHIMVQKFKEVPQALCGDDMGLGKTYEAIALDRLKRLRAGYPNGYVAKTLVVTTFSMLDTWKEELATTMPHLKVEVIDPKDRDTFIRAVQLGTADYYICHWDVLRMRGMEALAQRHWFHIIGDEIHKIKNRATQVTRCFKKIRGENKLGLSGTPGDNKPDDLWSPLNWLYPNKFSSYWAFFKYYCDYINLETPSGNGYRKITGVRNEKHLHREMAPFFIRRRKEEVLQELPDKYYKQVWVDLSPAQRRAYDQMRKMQLTWVGSQLETPIAAPIMIAQLIRLQQFALGMIRVDRVQKMERNKYFNPDFPEVPYDGDWRVNWKSRHAWVDEYHIEDPSSKIDAAQDIIRNARSDMPLVVFTQFKDVAKLLAQRLHKDKISYGVITGDHSKSQRDDVRRDFQAGKRQVFIGTIGSCREGLTLTKGSTEIFIDRAWSPSWNRQAEDRCHRIGQPNAVEVIDIMARNTVDLGRHQQIQQKWTWLQQMFGDKTFDYQKKTAKDGFQ